VSSEFFYSLYVGGVLHLGWAVFHLLFPRIFKWEQTLEPLDFLNRGIYQVLNICLTFWFVVVGYLSLVFAPDILTTPLGRKFLGAVTAFWLLRLGLQFRFFRAVHPVSLLLILMFVVTMAAYAYPLMRGVH